MSDPWPCRTCERGHLALRTFPRHGRMAAGFGTMIVVAALVALAVGLVDLLGSLPGRIGGDFATFLLQFAAWISACLLMAAIGAIARQSRTVFACTNCGAMTDALPAWADEVRAIESVPSASSSTVERPASTP